MLEALIQIINTMKNLQRLASEHRTESQLFSGNGIERMYQLLLQQLSNKIAFHNMEIFLEEDLRIQQQKVLIQNKLEEKKSARQTLIRQKVHPAF